MECQTNIWILNLLAIKSISIVKKIWIINGFFFLLLAWVLRNMWHNTLTNRPSSLGRSRESLCGISTKEITICYLSFDHGVIILRSFLSLLEMLYIFEMQQNTLSCCQELSMQLEEPPVSARSSNWSWNRINRPPQNKKHQCFMHFREHSRWGLVIICEHVWITSGMLWLFHHHNHAFRHTWQTYFSYHLRDFRTFPKGQICLHVSAL